MKTIDKLTVIFLVILFTFAGVDKLVHYYGFVNAINTYRILPIPMGGVLAPFIIAAELSIATGLVVVPWRRRAAFQAAMLMAILTFGLIGNRLLGSRGICGCWFSLTMAQGDVHFLFNGIIIAMSLFLWQSEKRAEREMPS